MSALQFHPRLNMPPTLREWMKMLWQDFCNWITEDFK